MPATSRKRAVSTLIQHYNRLSKIGRFPGNVQKSPYPYDDDTPARGTTKSTFRMRQAKKS